jgi:hypothetical protein
MDTQVATVISESVQVVEQDNKHVDSDPIPVQESHLQTVDVAEQENVPLSSHDVPVQGTELKQQEVEKRKPRVSPYINRFVPAESLGLLKAGNMCPHEKVKNTKGGCVTKKLCLNSKCKFEHVLRIPECPRSGFCRRYHTDQAHYLCYSHPIHELNKRFPCVLNEKCMNYNCNGLHDETRVSICQDPFTCQQYWLGECKLIHATKNLCKYGSRCRKIDNGCDYVHPPACNDGKYCENTECPFVH